MNIRYLFRAIIFIGLLIALGYAAMSSAHAPNVEWRCYTEPVIYQVDGYWVIECESGNEVSRDDPAPYPMPGDEPYPLPSAGCTRAWDGEPCQPSE
jgi:hypothetical protein